MGLVGAILAAAGRARPAQPFAIVPAFTFVATAIAVELCGYQPYLVDVDPDTWVIDAARLVEHPIRARTGVVVAASPFGRPVAQGPLEAFRDRTGIPVVVDGGACFEAMTDDPSLAGDVPVALSFHATKSFAIGEGGCVVTTNRSTARAVAQALNFGFHGSRISMMPSVNGKMSEYHAAVGLAELDRWEAKRQQLEATANRYRKKLDSAGLSDNFVGAPDVAGCYALLRTGDVPSMDRLHQSLNDAGVEFRHWYGSGLHHHAWLREAPRDALDVAQQLGALTVGLPTATDLAEDTVELVVAAVRRAVNRSVLA
jgi:dTDP-4-amino-4,6-dideoxygalactose transaminase